MKAPTKKPTPPADTAPGRVDSLITKAAEAVTSEDALRFSQAALNLANALTALRR